MTEKLQTNNQQKKELTIPEDFDSFLENGYEKYANYLEQFADRIDRKELEDVNWTLENMGYERGLELAVGYIAGALEIDKPKIKFQIIEGDKKARYGCDKRDNSIVVRRTPKEKYEDVLGISDAIEMIAHESWHAHQHDEIRKNSDRAQLLYKQKYIKAEDNLEEYFRQPYELEAYVFGEMIRNKFSRTRKRVLQRELNKTIGAITEAASGINKHLIPLLIEDKNKIDKKLNEMAEDEDERIRSDRKRRFRYIH